MKQLIISGTGLYTPEAGIDNRELADSFNEYVRRARSEPTGSEQLRESTAEFIAKASGIHHRYTVDREGVLDPTRMRPKIAPRADDELSLQAEMSLKAAREALDQAGLQGSDLDAIFVCCANHQRPYPALAIELQNTLGAGGFAFDLNVACSSSTFGIATGASMIRSGAARRVLVASPEICTGHLNFRDRDSHFIFGDACTAVVVEEKRPADEPQGAGYALLSERLATRFSNNIRNNRGFLSRCEDRADDDPSQLFYQQGRKVFKEVTVLATAHMKAHLAETDLQPAQLTTFWLHQANAQMNLLMAKRLLGREPTPQETPMILDRYANTSSAGSLIAFHLHREHMSCDDYGMICSFGAGYSIGSLLLRKL